MNKRFADYTWLAGNHGGRGSLWEGPDHLLVVEGKGLLLAFSEIYRRLDYKNIQAVTLTPTPRYTWMSVLLAAGVLFFSLMTVFTREQEVFIPISLALPAVLLAVLLVIHVARGKTCACTLQTAVQVLRLKPLRRMKVAQPVIARLEALCTEHQRNLATAEPWLAAASAQSSGFATTPPPSVFAPMAGAKPPWSGSVWVLIAGLLSIAWGLFLGGELFVDGVYFTTLGIVVGGASAVMGIVALVRAYQQSVPGPLAGALWAGLAMHLVSAMAVFALTVAATAESVTNRTPIEILESNQRTSEDALLHLAAFRFDQAGVWGWAFLAMTLVFVCLGAVQTLYAPRRKGVPGVAPATAPAPPAPPPQSQPPGSLP